MKPPYSIKQYSELFLKEIYDVAQDKGVSYNQTIYDIGRQLGIQDESEIENIYNVLADKRLVKEIAMMSNGDRVIHISHVGQHFIESGGQTQILDSVKGSVKDFITNNSITIHGNNYGQAVSNSSNISQAWKVSNVSEVVKDLNEIKSDIEKSELSLNQKQDALRNIELVIDEVREDKPKFKLIKPILENLPSIANIAEKVAILIDKYFP